MYNRYTGNKAFMKLYTQKKSTTKKKRKGKRIVERRKESFALDINGLIEKSFLGLLEIATRKKNEHKVN